MIGLRVGPFEIVEQADFPEPGDWFYARRSGMSQRKPTEVLVRVLPPDASADARVALQKHFDNLRQVEHARVPIAVAMYEGIGAMAITAVRGVPLTHVVAARTTDALPMTPATLLDLLLEVAEILQFAHHRGRPHGCLGPQHLLVAADGTVWVTGYAAGPTAEPNPLWVAPERARGEIPTEATDQWCLAALGSALITGKAPWPEDDPLTAARSGDPEPMITPVERQWPALARVLRKMLENRPTNRYPTMHQVRQELLALARKAGGTSGRRELGARLAELHGAGSDTQAPTVDSSTDDGPPSEIEDPPAPQMGDTLTPPDATEDPGSDPDAPEMGGDEDFQPTSPRVPPPERDTVPVTGPAAQLASDDDSEPPAPAKPSDPGIEIGVARSIEPGQGTPAPRRKATPLPAEQIPVVRPDLDGDVPAADRSESPRSTPGPRNRLAASDPASGADSDDVLQENTGPTMLADIRQIAAAQGVELPESMMQAIEDAEAAQAASEAPIPDPTDGDKPQPFAPSGDPSSIGDALMTSEEDEEDASDVATNTPQQLEPFAPSGDPSSIGDALMTAEESEDPPSEFGAGPVNVPPHPAGDPKSVSDPPSLPQALSAELDAHDQGGADYEATVLYTSAHLEEEAAGFALAAGQSDVPEPVEVRYEDDGHDGKSPTLAPTTDSEDHASQELPAPVPAPYPTTPSSVESPDDRDGFLPNNVPDSVGHEPELGSLHGNVSIRNEPAFGPDDDGPPPPTAQLPESSKLPQQLAMGAVGLLVLLMLAWVVRTFVF